MKRDKELWTPLCASETMSTNKNRIFSSAFQLIRNLNMRMIDRHKCESEKYITPPTMLHIHPFEKRIKRGKEKNIRIKVLYAQMKISTWELIICCCCCCTSQSRPFTHFSDFFVFLFYFFFLNTELVQKIQSIYLVHSKRKQWEGLLLMPLKNHSLNCFLGNESVWTLNQNGL